MNGLQTLVVERPYAELIWKGHAKLVISPQKLPAACNLAFADSKQIYGIVSLGKGRPIAISEFRRLQNSHLIPDEERVVMWPKARRLFAHSVFFKECYSEPRSWPGPPPEIETRFRRELTKTEKQDKRLSIHAEEVFNAVGIFKQRISGFVEQQLRLMSPNSSVTPLLNSMITLARDLRKEYANALDCDVDAPLPPQNTWPETLDIADTLYTVMKDAAPLLPANSRIGELTADGMSMLEDFTKLTAHFKEDKDIASAISTLRATKPSEPPECDTIKSECDTIKSDPFKDEVAVCKSFLYIIDNQDKPEHFHLGFSAKIQDLSKVQDAISKQLPNVAVLHPDVQLASSVFPVYDLVLRKRQDFEAYIAMQENDTLDLMSVDKEDPYLALPPKETPLKSVLQFHSRGRAAHLDFRIKVDNYLIGYTLAGSIAGRIPKFLNIDEAKDMAGKFDMKGSRWNKAFTSPKRIYATLKAVHPISWLNVTAEAFEPGSLGADKYSAGYMIKIAAPKVTWGVHANDYHEYFLEEDKEFKGILVFRKIESQPDTPQGEEGAVPKSFWIATIKQSLVPYIVSQNALNKAVDLPRNWSFLPPQLKAAVPQRYQYWKPSDEQERKETRKELIKEAFFTAETVKFVDGQLRRVVPKYHVYNPDPLKEDRAKRQDSYSSKNNTTARPPAVEDTVSKDTSQEESSNKAKKSERSIKGLVYEVVKRDGAKDRYKYGVGTSDEKMWSCALGVLKGQDRIPVVPVGCVKANGFLAEVGDVLHVHIEGFVYKESEPKRIEAVGQRILSVDRLSKQASLKDLVFTTIEQVETLVHPEEIAKHDTAFLDAPARNLAICSKHVRLIKYETRDATQDGGEEERFVLGEVLVPDEDDSQEDTYDAETVRRAAHYFMEFSPIIGLMHQRALSRAKVRVLESYVTPIDMTIEGRFVKQGTWLLGARIVDDDLWESVKNGTFTGWSIEGTAIAEEIT